MRRIRPFRLGLAAALGAGGFFLTLMPAFAGEDTRPDAPSSQPAPARAGPPPAGGEAKPDQPLTPDQLYEMGRDLFDEYAPPEIKEQYEFPSKEQWDAFAGKLQRALDGDSVEELAGYESQARAALLALRALPACADYADWIGKQLDLIEAARSTVRPPPPHPGPPAPAPPPAAGAQPRRVVLPYYSLWVQRLAGRPAPPNAADLMPTLRAEFSAAGVPPEFAWIAEVESALNPKARSPSGAKGLFQLMPETARRLGLSTWLPDERTDPARSARAAARLLREPPFGVWQLAACARRLQRRRRARGTSARGKECEDVCGDLPGPARGDPLLCPQSLRHNLTANGFAAGEVRRTGMRSDPRPG